MSTTTASRQPTRKPSFLRHKLRESFRPSALRGLLEHSEKEVSHNEKSRTSVDGKRQSMEESSWIARKRRKNKATKDEEPKHVIDELKIDVGGFEDFKSSLDPGSKIDLLGLRSPETVVSPATTTVTKETVLTLKPGEKPLMQKLNQNSPVKNQKMSFPQAMELEDTSNLAGRIDDPMDIDMPAPQPLLEPQITRGRKWEIKTDTLVRPVSSGRANALSANVSSTIAAINKNNFHARSKWSANVDSMASARPSVESDRSKMTAQTNYTDKVDSVIGSNASVTSARQPLGNTARTNTNRHTVAEVDKLVNSSADQENSKRQSFPAVAVRRQSYQNIKEPERPKSPTGSIASTATGAPRARRTSGTNVAARLSWLQEIEKNKTPGQEYMIGKLQGGVAEKLRRFESQNSETGSSASRAPSATRSQSATRGSDAYGIELGKRLSNTVTQNDDFRKKLEEQFQRKQDEDKERERKRNNRQSLPVGVGRTPQQIIDYAELNDNDREAEINKLMKDGKGQDNAKKLDTQAKAILAGGPRGANAVFQNAAAGLRSTTNLLDTIKNPAFGQSSKSTTSLGRTMSVQQKPTRKVSPIAKAPRPVSYAPSTPMSMDDEYDPFNYAVYPSRSSIYSLPPEAPAETPATEYEEEDIIPEIKELEIEKPVEAVARETKTEDNVKTTAATENSATKIAEAAQAPIARLEVTRVPKAASTEAPKPAASGWAARFNPTTANALAVLAPTSAPTDEESPEPSRPTSMVECVAQEAVPASPTLVDIPSRPSSKRNTPVKDRFVNIDVEEPTKEAGVKVDEPVIGEKPQPKSSMKTRSTAPAQLTTPNKQTPSELLLSNSSVKVASPCSSPKSPKNFEFNAAALPRLGTV